MEPLNIAIFQTDIVWENPELNRQHIEQMMKNISCETDLIVLPETFTTGFPANAEKYGEDDHGHTFRWMHSMAQKRNCCICGSILTNIEEKHRNTFIWMQPDGNYHLYHKRHAFSFGSENVETGTENIIIKYKGWTIKPFICYDIRFPVWIRNRYNNGIYDYDIALFVANWPEARADVLGCLCRARAIENMAYVISANRVGIDGSNIVYKGHSGIISPKGQHLLQAKTDAEEVLEYRLEKTDLEHFREKFRVANDWDNFELKPDAKH